MKVGKSDKKVSKWLVFISMPIQMGVTIYLFYWVGNWLDGRFPNEGDWWGKALTMIGVIVSLYQFIRQANQINKNEK